VTQEKEKGMGLPGKIETAANVAVVVVAALLSAILVKVYLLPAAPTQALVPPNLPNAPTAAGTVGTNLNSRIPGVDWSKNGQTLVLALSSHCHFCTESAPLYRRLAQVAGKAVKIVAILPEPVPETEKYLQDEGVHVDQVKQMALASIGVAGTPTMLVVNGSGIVTKSWVGRLDQDGQEQVLSALAGVQHGAVRRATDLIPAANR
jgi:thiol-disulfide isomerase/thioredoxin